MKRLTIRFTDSMHKRIEEYKNAHDDVMDMSEAIRRLISVGLLNTESEK